MMKSRYCLLFVILALQHAVVNAQFHFGYPHINTFGIFDYAGQPQVWSLTSNSKDVLFFGNNNGLLLFDGIRWERHEVANRSVVRAVASAHDGMVYVGAVNELGYLKHCKYNGNDYHSLTSQIPDDKKFFNDVSNIIFVNNTAYFITLHNIFAFRNQKLVGVISTDNEMRLGGFAWDSRLFVFLTGKGLGLLQGDSLITIKGSEFLANRGVVGIKEVLGDPVLVSSIGGSYFASFNDSYTEVNLTPTRWQCNNELTQRYVFDFDVTPNYLVYALLKGGVLVTDHFGNPLSLIGKEQGLSDNVVTDLLVDKRGNIWTATQNGISHILLESDRTYIDFRSGFDNPLSAAYVDKNLLYLGSNFRLKTLKLNESYSPDGAIVQEIKDDASQVWHIDKHNGILLCAQRTGLYKIENQNVVPIKEGLGTVWGFVPLKTDSSKLIVGGNGLHVFQFNAGEWVYMHTVEGFSDDVRWFAQCTNGHIWVTHLTKGVKRLTLNHSLDSVVDIRLYDHNQGLPSPTKNYVWQIDPDVWVGTQSGIYNYNLKSDSFEPIPTTNSTIFDGDIWLLQKGQDSKVYYVGDTQMGALLRNADGSFESAISPFSGIEPRWVYSMRLLGDSLILLGYSNQVIAQRVDENKPFIMPDKTMIRRVLSVDGSIFDSSLVNSHDELTLPYKLNGLKAIFGASPVSYQGKAEFSVCLEGYDNGWSDWTDKPEKEYMNLFEGNYTLKVRARDERGIRSNITTLSFKILPPWYRTIWAYITYIFLFFLISYLIVSLFVRNLKKKNLRLESIVKARTEELQIRNTELEEQKLATEIKANELAEANKKLRALIEYRQNLSHMLVHDLKNPLNAVLGLAEHPLVIHSGQTMLQLINNILDVQKLDDAQMVLQTEVVPLNRIISESVKSVEWLAQEKQISFKVSGSIYQAVIADVSLIERVCTNLLNNALKYSPSNSQVLVKTSLTQGYARVEVQDSGPGIPAQFLKTIFDPYVQVAPKDLGITHSTGLGLTFCRLAIDAHNGRIGVDSEEGHGANFWFEIPLAEGGESTEFQDIESNRSKDDNLSPQKKEQILFAAPDLPNVEVFMRSRLQSIIATLKEINDDEIFSWTIELERVVKSCNETAFKKMIENLKDG